DVALQQAAALRRAVGADVAHQRAVRLFLAEGLGHGRRDVLRDDPQIGARHFPVLEYLVHDRAGQVHGNGETDALIAFGTVREDGGIDADQFTAMVDQRSAGVAGGDGRVGLDEVFVGFNAQVGATGGADNSHGHGFADAEGIADRESVVADLDLGRVADHDGRQSGSVDLEDGDIGLGIGADDAGFELALVGEGHFDVRGFVDDMIVGEDVTLGADDHAGAEPLLTLFLRFALDAAAALGTIAEELAEFVGDLAVKRGGRFDDLG